MRKTDLCEGFCIIGSIPGAAKPDVAQEVSLPFRLQSLQEVCGQEGLFLRSWELITWLDKPEEEPHSHAERTILTLDGISGSGELCIGEDIRMPLEAHMELDVTQALRNGSTRMRLCFPQQHPFLLNGEYGCDLIAQGSLFSAELRNIFHMRFEKMTIARDGEVRMHIHAYGAGKVRIRLRLMADEDLLWSENSTVQLVVGSQVITRKIDAACLRRGAVLYAAADMGGEGCDRCEAVYSDAPEVPRYIAHFRALPNLQMLREIRAAGFDGAAFYEYPHKKLLDVCAQLGLHAVWKKSDISLQPLLRQDAVCETESEGCMYVPMQNTDERHCFDQAQRLRAAVLKRRMDEKCVEVLALSRQRDAQDGLFDADGKVRIAMYAVRNALGKFVMCMRGTPDVYRAYEEFSEEIMLLCAVPDHKPAVVQVQLFAWNGKEIAARVFPLCIKESVHSLGRFRARLPMNDLKGLMLRMQCVRNGRILAVDHIWFHCAEETGERISFPETDITECADGELCNAGNAVAMGVCITCDGEPLLNYGAMLPQERIAIAHKGEIMVKYGNAIGKGGKECVKQRILRGVFTDPNAAAADPEAVHS